MGHNDLATDGDGSKTDGRGEDIVVVIVLVSGYTWVNGDSERI